MMLATFISGICVGVLVTLAQVQNMGGLGLLGTVILITFGSYTLIMDEPRQ